MALKVKTNLFDLWNKAEGSIKRIIEVQEVELATGIAWSTIKRMKQGKQGNLDKFAAICEYLYKVSGLEIPYNAPVPWLVFVDEPDSPSIETP